ncbi:hypothetical protein BDZ97DRAFT_1828649 [Flammula alnicola]|nr:hypothetical protein BDZ97DRAFT_1828649 [Flammula alnicola]
MDVDYSLEEPRPLSHGSTNIPAIVSPIYNIPVEILRKIFEHVIIHPELEDDIYDPYATLTSPNASAHTTSYMSCASTFTLSHVCRHWHNVALEFPSLWSALRVIWPRDRHIELIELWLARGKSCSVSLYLHQGFESFYMDNLTATAKILTLFIQHIKRWKSIELVLQDSVETLIPYPIELKPDSLESLKIVLRKGETNRVPRTRLCVLLHSSPKLRTVLWDTSARHVTIPIQEMEWSNVVDLTLNFTFTQSLSELLYALTQCKSLQSLTVHHRSKPPRLHDILPSVTMPQLRRLNFGEFTQMYSMFANMTLPSLAELHLPRGILFASRETWESIQEMLQRSSCNLQAFIIGASGRLGLEEELCISNLRSKNFASLTRLELHFRKTSSRIDFPFSSDDEILNGDDAKDQRVDGQASYIAQLSAKNDSGKYVACFCVRKGHDGRIKPVDIACAARCAFALEGEHSRNV